MFHSTSYKEGKSFRNDTVCFIQQSSSLLCGEITVFVMKPVPVALINVLHPRELSIIHQAGNPAREALLQYKDIDFLEHYFMPIDARKSPLIAVEVKNIRRKGVLVETDSCVL